MRILLPALVVATAIVIGACHGGDTSPTTPPNNYTNPAITNLASLKSCGTSTSLFDAMPFPATLIAGWVPLGNLNPSAHTFPTDHQYIYLTSFITGNQTPVPLYAPGDVTVLWGKVSKYSSPAGFEDYSVTFAPCAEVSAEFGHVRTITPTLASQIGPFDQNCQTYSPNPGLTVTQCYSKNVKVAVKSGDAIGTAAGLDLNLYDSRVPAIVFANPARWQTSTNKIDRYHTVPMSDYYSEPTRTTVQALVGSYDGRIRRTALPPGGTIATDVAGTVQGAWLNPSQPTFPESPHFAIGPDNVDPTKLQLSMGTSQTGFLANLYYLGVPATSGFVNRDPAQITPGTQIYCYDFQNQYGMALLQLTDATTLKFEGRNGASRNCASEQPWAFSVSAVTFKR